MSQTVRTLVVEDNPADAALTAEQLQSNGQDVVVFEVVHVQTLAAANAWLTSNACDVVLLDLNLPDSQGLDTLRQLKGSHSTVVLSGGVDEQLRVVAIEAGAVEVLSKDEVGSRLFMLTVLYVVERNRAREQERRLARVLDTTPDAIVVVGRSGEVRYLNSQAEALFGRSRAELMQERLTFSAPPGTPVELRVVRPGGERIGEMRVAELDWEGEPSSLAAIRDVTQQRNLELQLVMSDRLASLGTLAAGVAHEINNPLSVVIANLGVAVDDLSQQGVDPDVGEALRDAHEASQRIRDIVKDLRIFARADTEMRGAFDVHALLESVVRMARNEVMHRARLVRDFGAVRAVFVNEARMSQVFLNLLVNAAQAIPEGDVRANAITLVTRMVGTDRVAIEFRDTGAGIPVAVQRRLFTPFFTTKPVGVGTGLGLAICQRIVQSADGEISFESEVGKGTCFRVVLPAADVEPTAVAPQHRASLTLVRKRLLVIDDEPAILSSVRRALGGRHEVLGFERGTEALEVLAAGERFDLVLCDVMMPQMSGLEFCSAVEQLDPTQAARVVLITGGAFSSQSSEFVRSGQFRVLTKPIDTGALRALVDATSPLGSS